MSARAGRDEVAGTRAGRGYAMGFLRDVVFGPEIQRYIERIESTFAPFGGEWLVHGTRPEVLEGPWSADVVLIGFPSIAAAREWYASPAYQDILDLRVENSRSCAVLLEGVPPGYRAADTVAAIMAERVGRPAVVPASGGESSGAPWAILGSNQ